MAIDGPVSQTAVEAWDKRWATREGRADWLEPQPAVVAILPELHPRGARRVFDLGCGVGRHALLFAEQGFDVERSTAACARDGRSARPAGEPAPGPRRRLVAPRRLFDYVLSWNVFHHGTLASGSARPGGSKEATRKPAY